MKHDADSAKSGEVAGLLEGGTVVLVRIWIVSSLAKGICDVALR